MCTGVLALCTGVRMCVCRVSSSLSLSAQGLIFEHPTVSQAYGVIRIDPDTDPRHMLDLTIVYGRKIRVCV